MQNGTALDALVLASPRAAQRYQKQIEDAGRKVLGKEKFAELKNMARGDFGTLGAGK